MSRLNLCARFNQPELYSLPLTRFIEGVELFTTHQARKVYFSVQDAASK